MEKAYLAMKRSGAAGITIGIIILAVGIAAGILSIVSGANLLKHKREITFYTDHIRGRHTAVPFQTY